MKMRIVRDENAESPQECGDDSLFLVANHRSFFVPPSHGQRNFSVEDVIAEHTHSHWVFPLEAYIHSGVVLALGGCGNFPDRQWDVSTLGAVFVSRDEWPEYDKAREAALSLVNEWNQYLSGDVWGFVIEDDNGETVDSCWGFYGEEYAKEEGQSALDNANQKEAMAVCAGM